MVAVVGETTIDVADEPVFQLQLVPPAAVNEVEPPKQIELELDVIDKVGLAFTAILTVLVAVHPTVVVPTTVYIVEAVGLMTKELPVKLPGLHV